MAKKFFYVCAGLFLLAAAYAFGARSAGAQSPANPVVASIPNNGAYQAAVVTANGDVYTTSISALDHGWTFRANVFGTGGPTSAEPETWGKIKARYR